MDWLALSYSLSTRLTSSPRVMLWRRLRRLGSVAVAGGPQVLPARDDCQEAFSWLAQEIHQAGGDAVVMRVQHFTGLSDAQLIEMFQAERAVEYNKLDQDASALEHQMKAQDHTQAQETLARLQKRQSEIAQMDYFGSPAGLRVAKKLLRIQQALSPQLEPANVPRARIVDYQGKHWVTRPRPHVDRLASAWLIRRHIDSSAVIRYALQPSPDEITFDMEDAHFGHQGNLCTFETLQRAFALNDPGLQAIAEIVHEIDLRDGLFSTPQIAGVDAILTGWLTTQQSDSELEAHGIALFEGLYAWLISQARQALQPKSQAKKKKR